MPSWLTQGQLLAWFSRVLSPDLRFADILPVGTLMIPAAVHRSQATYRICIHGLWGVIISFGVRRYRTVLKVNLKL